MIRRIACIRIPPSPTADPDGTSDPTALAQLSGALLTAAPRVTPVRDHPRAFWADASGMERRGQDAGVAQALLHAAREAGFPSARVGIAATCIAAAAATRERGSAWRVVPPGRDAEFLRRRSLAAKVALLASSGRTTRERIEISGRLAPQSVLPQARIRAPVGLDVRAPGGAARPVRGQSSSAGDWLSDFDVSYGGLRK